MQNIALEKHQLRRSCRQIRNEISETARQQASQLVCTWLECWSVFQNSSVILTYMPMAGEVDLSPLLRHQAHKQWVLPRIIPEENHRMVFHPYKSDQLIRHSFGMDEPTPDLPIIGSSALQLALVPGLAFDRQGRRLGYGGGYFDRFLRDFTGVSVGVTFRALLLDHIPFDELDVPVEWVVTDEGLLHTKSRR